MPDTIGFWEIRRLLSAYHSTSSGNPIVPKGWKVEVSRGFDAWCFTHIKSGLRAWFKSSLLSYVEVSLPRILFGSNGRLIRNQKQLSRAEKELERVLLEIAEPALSARRIIRLDLAWHVAGDPEAFVAAHRLVRHPFVRADPVIQTRHSISWGKGKNRFRLLIYDKCRQMKLGKGNVVRVEVQLRSKRLSSTFPTLLDPNGVLCRIPHFKRLYKAFRKILVKLSPRQLPKLRTIADLFAIAENHQGVSLFDCWSVGKNAQHVRRTQAKVAACQLRYSKIAWKRLLPLKIPPPAIDVLPKGTRTSSSSATTATN